MGKTVYYVPSGDVPLTHRTKFTDDGEHGVRGHGCEAALGEAGGRGGC